MRATRSAQRTSHVRRSRSTRRRGGPECGDLFAALLTSSHCQSGRRLTTGRRRRRPTHLAVPGPPPGRSVSSRSSPVSVRAYLHRQRRSAGARPSNRQGGWPTGSRSDGVQLNLQIRIGRDLEAQGRPTNVDRARDPESRNADGLTLLIQTTGTSVRPGSRNPTVPPAYA